MTALLAVVVIVIVAGSGAVLAMGPARTHRGLSDPERADPRARAGGAAITSPISSPEAGSAPTPDAAESPWASVLLAQTQPTGEDWRPAEELAPQFVWCVVGLDNGGDLVHHLVMASSHHHAVAAAHQRVKDLARVIGASPVSL